MSTPEALMTQHYSGAFPFQQEREHQCEAIGAVLLQAEAGSPRVGIPWIFPTIRVRESRKVFYEPVEDFLKTGLVTVNTKSLEEYCYDLDSLPDSIDSMEELKIRLYSSLERNSFVGLMEILSLAAFTMVGIAISADAWTFSLLWIIGALLGYLIGNQFSSDRARRYSFYLHLTREILRRHGIDGDGRERIRLSSVDPKPIK